MKAAREEEVPVSESQDLREEHQEQQAAQHQRDAQVRGRRWTARRWGAALQAGAEGDPV
jgi:hypothetical protein